MAKTSGKYVDGFVIAVPKSKTAAYKKMATEGKRMWLKHGALDYKECIGDDLNIKGMPGYKPLLFPKMTKLKKGETVWFSFIVYKSRAHRDAVNKKVMGEMDKMAEKYKDMEMPFETNRMAYGGFKVLVG